jgi:phosphoglycerate dehydrogenase-like enzyme
MYYMSCRKLLLLYKPSELHLRFFQSFDNWEVYHTTTLADAQNHIKEAEVVLGNHQLVQSLQYAKKLRWLQVASSGVDFILPHLPADIAGFRVTNARGVYDDEMAEHSIALLLSLFRELHLTRDRQACGVWQRNAQLRTLASSTIMILGWGSLGKSISKKLGAFGCKILVVSTSEPAPKPLDVQWISANDWLQELYAVDALIIALPSTPSTQMIVNKHALSRLPDNAFVINIGRAEVLEEQALFEMLQDQKIAGAALDVFNEEPLPKDHIAWKIPNLIVSPHTSRSKEEPPYKYEKLFEENFHRYTEGLPLLNQVNIAAGY